MPRRKQPVEPQIDTNAEFDFTPTTTQPRESGISPSSYHPPDRSRSIDSLPSVLQSPDLDWKMPDFQGLQPTNLFRPSSSAIPQTDDQTFAAEMKICHEQNNSLKLLNANLDNVSELATAAVKASKIAQKLATALVGFRDAQVTYTIGMQAAEDKLETGQAKNAAKRANGLRDVAILNEKGNQLDQKLRGEQIRTGNESKRADHLNLETTYLDRLTPILEEEWNNKLEAARSKAAAARVGTQNTLNGI